MYVGIAISLYARNGMSEFDSHLSGFFITKEVGTSKKNICTIYVNLVKCWFPGLQR